MIGPGWLPSRPRPLARVRFYMRRPRAHRPRPAPCPARPIRAAQEAGSRSPEYRPGFLRFDAAQAELPIATLLPSASQARHRVIAAALRRELARSWAWIRPRSVPLIVAFAGLVAVLGATKYLSVYACNDAVLRAAAGAPGVPARDLATRERSLPRADAPLWPGVESGALVQTLPDNWPGCRSRLQLHGDVASSIESALDQPDGCSLARARLR